MKRMGFITTIIVIGVSLGMGLLIGRFSGGLSEDPEQVVIGAPMATPTTATMPIVTMNVVPSSPIASPSATIATPAAASTEAPATEPTIPPTAAPTLEPTVKPAVEPTSTVVGAEEAQDAYTASIPTRFQLSTSSRPKVTGDARSSADPESTGDDQVDGTQGAELAERQAESAAP